MPRTQVRDLGKGSFGITKLMQHRTTGELVAVKLIERGTKVSIPIITALPNCLFTHLMKMRNSLLSVYRQPYKYCRGQRWQQVRQSTACMPLTVLLSFSLLAYLSGSIPYRAMAES